MRQSGEPSVEEILESIKKVIARDTRAAVDELAQGQADLASRVATDEVLDLTESAELADEQPHAAAPLVTEVARTSMRDSLAALAMLSEPGAQPQIVRSGETSLEGLTRELLRPALAEWLDTHLPPMVERMVAAEISRIVGKKG
jgi:cell pole-organizing protein PopZ